MKSLVTFLKKKNEYGGPGTFLMNLTKWMDKNNLKYDYYPSLTSKKIFVISSTRKIFFLISKKINGYKIIQRLDGYLWDHKYSTNKKIFIKYTLINILMNFIRKHLADIVVYQTHYLKKAWEKKFGKVDNCKVIYNAANNTFYNNKKKICKKFRIVCVEGVVQSNFYTFNILKSLSEIAEKNSKIDRLEIYGKCPNIYKKNLINSKKTKFMGIVSKKKISNIYKRNRIIFFVLEQFPACPNSVIEALASNTVVTGFNNGSLPEMLEDKNYLVNFSNIENLKNFNLTKSIIEKKINFIILNFKTLQKKIKSISKKFNINSMGKNYLKVLKETI